MKTICSFILVLGLAIPALGQTPNSPDLNLIRMPFKSDSYSRLILYSGLAFDLTTTEIALKRGAVEGNPVLGKSAARRIPSAVALTIGADLLIHRFMKEDSKKQKIIRTVLGGLHFAVGANNLRIR